MAQTAGASPPFTGPLLILVDRLPDGPRRMGSGSDPLLNMDTLLEHQIRSTELPEVFGSCDLVLCVMTSGSYNDLIKHVTQFR